MKSYEIVQYIKQLPLKEAADAEFQRAIRDALANKIRSWYDSQEYTDEIKSIATKNQERRQAKLRKESRTEQWVVQNIKPGTLVSMSGTRDRTGLRMVEKVETGQFPQLICRKVSPCVLNDVLRYQYNTCIKIGRKYFFISSDVTSHGAGKLRDVYSNMGLIEVDESGNLIESYSLLPIDFD